MTYEDFEVLEGGALNIAVTFFLMHLSLNCLQFYNQNIKGFNESRILNDINGIVGRVC